MRDEKKLAALSAGALIVTVLLLFSPLRTAFLTEDEVPVFFFGKGDSNLTNQAKRMTAAPAPTLTAPAVLSPQTLALDFVNSHYQVVGELRISHVTQETFVNLGRQLSVFVIVEDTRTDGARIYHVYVDPETGETFESDRSLWEEEIAAHEAKYGKMGVDLYERLQEMEEDELINVGIWAAAEPEESLAAVQASADEVLAARHPEAQEAMDRFDDPLAVPDATLRAQLQREYIAIVEEIMHKRTGSVRDVLDEYGYGYREFAGMPRISARLPKWLILELSRHSGVSAIERIDD